MFGINKHFGQTPCCSTGHGVADSTKKENYKNTIVVLTSIFLMLNKADSVNVWTHCEIDSLYMCLIGCK